MSNLINPICVKSPVDAHNKWLKILNAAQTLVEEDVNLQEKAEKGLLIKERPLPPEVLGRIYVEYCQLINEMYDAYLDSVHLQRLIYMKEIIGVFMKRMFELRNELVHVIVNDYIYVDAALRQTKLTPMDIQIVVPYHIPLESRPHTMEELLQTMWSDAVKRKKAPSKPKPKSNVRMFGSEDELQKPQGHEEPESSEEEEEPQESIVPEEFIQSVIIQKHERFRQFFMVDLRAKTRNRRLYNPTPMEEVPLLLKADAAKLIQTIYREYMKVKRKRQVDFKRDVLLGLVLDPSNQYQRMSYEEENNKVYEMRRNKRMKLEMIYKRDLEYHNRKLLYKKDDQIMDITVHIQEWFKDWIYGYSFFPEYPYDIEGGTIMVIRGDYETVEERIEADEKYLAKTKGKTKEQLQQEKQQAKFDAKIKAEAQKEAEAKEAEALFKMRCNPFADPGYKPKTSEHKTTLKEVFQKYQSSWSIYDNIAPERQSDVVYGYILDVLKEDIMCQIHQDCRRFVDELMRLELKLLVKAHQKMYKSVGWKYPRMKARPKPKSPTIPKPFKFKDNLKDLEILFDLGLITKPSAKIKDIFGDYNYAAYDLNLKDPDATFPPPGYGDIRRRLILSCVFGSGIEPAARKKSAMLLGQERNGKSFLVDAVAGEINAVKIDISPEVFSAVLEKSPAKVLPLVFLAAKLFQPAVIFMKNVERVFCKTVPPEQKHLNAKTLKTALQKQIKQISTDDKIIFIATCTNPFVADRRPLVSLFNEIILVPTTDYGSLQRFFYDKLQSIKSMERDLCVQSLAQLLRGYGFGVVLELYNTVMTPERIVRLNVTPLSFSEFLEIIFERGFEPLSLEDYNLYVDFFIKNSPLKTEREEYAIINAYRAVVYEKFEKDKKKT